MKSYILLFFLLCLLALTSCGGPSVSESAPGESSLPSPAVSQEATPSQETEASSEEVSAASTPFQPPEQLWEETVDLSPLAEGGFVLLPEEDIRRMGSVLAVWEDRLYSYLKEDGKAWAQCLELDTGLVTQLGQVPFSAAYGSPVPADGWVYRCVGDGGERQFGEKQGYTLSLLGVQPETGDFRALSVTDSASSPLARLREGPDGSLLVLSPQWVERDGSFTVVPQILQVDPETGEVTLLMERGDYYAGEDQRYLNDFCWDRETGLLYLLLQQQEGETITRVMEIWGDGAQIATLPFTSEMDLVAENIVGDFRVQGDLIFLSGDRGGILLRREGEELIPLPGLSCIRGMRNPPCSTDSGWLLMLEDRLLWLDTGTLEARWLDYGSRVGLEDASLGELSVMGDRVLVMFSVGGQLDCRYYLDTLEGVLSSPEAEPGEVYEAYEIAE